MGTNDDLLQDIEPSLGAAAPAQPESSSQGTRITSYLPKVNHKAIQFRYCRNKFKIRKMI